MVNNPALELLLELTNINGRATGNISTLSTPRTTNKRLTISLNSEQPLILEEVQQRASKAREREGDAEKRQRNRRRKKIAAPGPGPMAWWSTGPLLPLHCSADTNHLSQASLLLCFGLQQEKDRHLPEKAHAHVPFFRLLFRRKKRDFRL